MPTENKAAPFHREDRYNVIKYTDLERLPHAERRAVNGFLRRIHESILKAGAPARQSVVIESDWPEYEPVWQMIERRMTGQPVADFDRVTAERDALQALLTAADERVDVLEGLLRRVHKSSALTKAGDLWQRIDAALKPAEGGGDGL